MKYCSHCGEQLYDNAVICPKCGCATGYVEPSATATTQSAKTTLRTIALIFMIIGCIANGFALIPLIWCIPMTIKYNNSIKEGTNVSMAFKVCTLLFVNLIAGVLMLCDNDNLTN